jgi:hypothetical protein
VVSSASVGRDGMWLRGAVVSGGGGG